MTPPARLPVVVVGEALVDVVVPQSGEPSSAVGGSPLNVAVGLARLDVPTVLVTRIGDDEHGRWIAEHVRESGVELAEGSVVAGRRTSTATAHLDHEHTARYEFDLEWDLDHAMLPAAAGLHVGSLGATLLPGRLAVDRLVGQAQERDLFVSYDPNVRPAFVADTEATWRAVAGIAARSRLVKLSEEDVRALRPDGGQDGDDELAAELLSLGVTELVVVTRGAAGMTAYTSAFQVHEPAAVTEVVDTVGAGDAFMSAMLAILSDWQVPSDGPGALEALDEDRVRLMLRGAAVAAAVTCARRGAEPPRRRELPPTWPR